MHRFFAAVEGCRRFDKELIELAHLVKKGAQDGFEEPAARAQAALLPLLTTFEARASAFLSEEVSNCSPALLKSRQQEQPPRGCTLRCPARPIEIIVFLCQMVLQFPLQGGVDEALGYDLHRFVEMSLR